MAGLKRESIPFNGMIKLKLKFFKGMWNKITKSISYFPFILELKTEKRKRLRDTKTFQQWEEGKRRKKKEKIKRKLIKIAIGILNKSHILSSIICRLCIYIYKLYELFHIHNILSWQLVNWTLTQLLYSEMKNFTNSILRLFGVKQKKLYSVNLSWR